MTNPNYEIWLTVHDKDGNVVGRRKSSDTEIIEQSIGDIPKWISKYEELKQLIERTDEE
jgi:hypothetical protein